MSKTITLTPAKRIDDAYAIDAANHYSGDDLKSVCLVWHGAASGTITAPSLNGPQVEVPALRTSLVQRSTGVWDCHLVVSESIFNVIRSGLNSNHVFQIEVEHQTSPFLLARVSPPAVVEPDSLQTISHALQSTNEKVVKLGQDVASIKDLLANALVGEHPASVMILKSNGFREYKSRGGAPVGP